MLISLGLSLKNSLVRNVSKRKRSFSEQFFSSGSGIAANYDLVIQAFNGCGTPVLKGHPVCGEDHRLEGSYECLRSKKLYQWTVFSTLLLSL